MKKSNVSNTQQPLTRKLGGFTFIEFICVLGILSVLYFVALPLGSTFQARNQLHSLSNELATAIRYARNAALFSNRRLALTPSSLTNDWSKGMILFVDNEKHRYEQHKDELLYQWKWHYPGINTSWTGFQSNDYLLFSEDLKHAAISGHFALIDSTGNQATLVVNRIGRVHFLEK